ncbi:MAG: DUF1015 family protein [Euryarchaeota archaeon]|nr:DUF1015 family protein [Euryarchaeota archaeon]
MVKLHRFAALRPLKSESTKIASVPYDVINAEESRATIEKNPESFLRVIRPDALLQNLPANDSRVYELAKKNLDDMVAGGLLMQDAEPGIYLYRVKQGGSIYTGFVANVSVKDYEENKIRRHEHTRYEKEEDRTRHIDTTNAHTGLVVLLYRDPGEIFSYVESLVPASEPDASVKDDIGAVHEIFQVADEEALSRLEEMFEAVPAFYIADGHHRAKSSVNVARQRREDGTVTDDAERFMAIIFAENRVKVHGYSRLITDLGDYTPESFISALGEIFDVTGYGEIDETVFLIPPLKSSKNPLHVMHMYLDGVWYELSCPVENPDDVVASFDVSVLQKRVIGDMLGISDPRGNPRLQYLGGARPLADLEVRVDSGSFAVAFSMQPVKVESVLSIADEGKVMPPKSTWFEPKLLSGLTVHKIE